MERGWKEGGKRVAKDVRTWDIIDNIGIIPNYTKKQFYNTHHNTMLLSVASSLNLSILWLQIWKTLETTDTRLSDMVLADTSDVIALFQDDSSSLPPKSPLERDKFRADKIETEDFYLNVCWKDRLKEEGVISGCGR